jgi:D-glycero-D-manno-heptose 1,7-bisphosphate phosphatase
MKKPAVFLDRDDTLVHNADLPESAWEGGKKGDLLDPNFIDPLPGVFEACRDLKKAGFLLIVVTNQGGVARGHGTIEDVDECHETLSMLLTDEMGEPFIDAFYACPYHPEGVVEKYAVEHEWRKPSPGMLFAAEKELDIDLASSWMVGDAARDIEAGVNAGLDPSRCLRIGPGQAFADLAAAAAEIVSQVNGGGEGGSPRTAVALRAREAWLLDDEGTARIVRASAESIAERTGVELHGLAIEAGRAVATLGTHRLGALGFAAELRRVTDLWHEGKRDMPLWIDESDAEDGEFS